MLHCIIHNYIYTNYTKCQPKWLWLNLVCLFLCIKLAAHHSAWRRSLKRRSAAEQIWIKDNAKSPHVCLGLETIWTFNIKSLSTLFTPIRVATSLTCLRRASHSDVVADWTHLLKYRSCPHHFKKKGLQTSQLKQKQRCKKMLPKLQISMDNLKQINKFPFVNVGRFSD